MNNAKARYAMIREYMDPRGKTLIDLCCNEGQFINFFMNDGGKRAIGIDNNYAYANVARAGKAEEVFHKICDVSSTDYFDYGFYLDTHYHLGTELYLTWIAKKAHTCFISPSGRQEQNYNARLIEDLDKTFSSVIYIGTGEYGRKIFKCE